MVPRHLIIKYWSSLRHRSKSVGLPVYDIGVPITFLASGKLLYRILYCNSGYSEYDANMLAQVDEKKVEVMTEIDLDF